MHSLHRVRSISVTVTLAVAAGLWLHACRQSESPIDPGPTLPTAATVGSWSGPVTWPIVVIHAALLPNGRVLAWGRTEGPVVWDPAVPTTFAPVARPVDLFCTGHSFLPDGRLLVSGGHGGKDNVGIKATVIFDFQSNSWTHGRDMRNGRWYPTQTTLPNGEILTISGGDTAEHVNVIPEVWQADGTWRLLSSASRNVPYYPWMFVAPDGRVYSAGPERATSYLMTSGTGQWTSGPSSNYGYRDYGSAAMYDAGKILIVGGGYPAPTNTAEVIDLNAGAATWRQVAPMSVARRHVNATLLANGSVLVTSGTNASGFNSFPTTSAVLAAELWNPTTEQWTTLAFASRYRAYHATSLLLADGRVLVAGSGQPAAPGLSDDYTAEIFTPPYLYAADGSLAPRPTIASAPQSVSYGQSFTVDTPDAATIAKITWIRLPSVTHAFDQGQRSSYLAYTVTGGSSLSLTAPANANVAPPGHYLLFLVNASGVPSVAKIVQIS